MTTHWKIPKPEWEGDRVSDESAYQNYYAGGINLGQIEANGTSIAAYVGDDYHGNKFTTESAARSWVEAQAMKALGAEECE